MPRFPALNRDLRVDAVVVGGGITGVTAAYLLKKAGKSVAVIERGRCGGVDTACTTAHVTCVTDKRLHQLVDSFGKERAKAAWDAGLAAMDQIYSNIQNEELACEFKWVPGYLHAPLGAKGDAGRKAFERDAQLANEFGFRADFLDSIPEIGAPGVRFAHQAKFHPLKYAGGLLRTLPGRGCHVFEQTAMEEVEEKPLAVRAGRHKITCDYLVLATHNPLMGKANILSATLLQTKLALYSSYAIGARIAPGLWPEASFWDTAEPYHYLRIDRRRGFDYAIFGGADHKTGQQIETERAYKELERVFRQLVPSARIDHRWSGQVIETPDGLPFIGELGRDQFVATGFAGNGMTFGTLAGMMAVDHLLGRKNPWRDLFAVNRKPIRGGIARYLKENKDYPYYLVRDWAARSEGKSLRDLSRNQGRILTLDGKRVAAYRDEHGGVSLCSPVCTHLKCIVAWNKAEQTWDCPCHGSRFKPTGEVISGPAEEDLQKIPVPKGKQDG